MASKQYGDGSLCQVGDGRWMAVYWVDGRKHTKRSVNRQVCDKWLKTAKRTHGASLTSTTPKSEGGTTVDTWMRKYLWDILPSSSRCRQNTMHTYRGLYENWISPTLGPKVIDELDGDDIRALHKAMQKAGKAASTIRQTHVLLSRAFKVAIREKAATVNACTMTDGVTVEEVQTHALTEEEARRIWRTAQALPRNSARWLIGLTIGSRQGEVLGLTWENVDLETGRISTLWQLQRMRAEHGCGQGHPARVKQHNGKVVTRTVYPCGQRQPAKCPTPSSPGGLRLVKVKTKKSERHVVLGPVMLDVLRKHHRQQRKEQLARGVNGWEREPGKFVHLVFCQPNGRPIDPRHDTTAYKELLRAAQVDEVRLHDLRHTAATIALEAGESIEAVSAMLGHDDSAFTERQYVHRTDRLRARTASAVEGVMLAENNGMEVPPAVPEAR